MSNQTVSNAWLAGGDGPGSPRRPGHGRYAARNALVKHHNLRGEAVFLASRRWHAARAQTAAAKMRLERALREADAAEMAELQALMSMGIGRRRMAAFSDRGGGFSGMAPPRPGGYRDQLEKRIAAEAADAPRSGSKIPSRARSAPPERPSGGGGSPAKSGNASDARAAWLAKMQGTGAAAPDGPPVATGALEVKKPRRGGKAATTRD